MDHTQRAVAAGCSTRTRNPSASADGRGVSSGFRSSSGLGLLALFASLADPPDLPGRADPGPTLRGGPARGRSRARQPHDRERRSGRRPLRAGAARAEGSPTPRPSRRPTLLYFYGNGMCLNDALDAFDHFRRLGANVLIPEYVGYGMSGGQPSESGCRATADAAYDHLQRRKDVDPRRDRGRRLVAGRGGRHRPGLTQAGRRAGRLLHLHQHGRDGAAELPLPPHLAAC